MTSTRTSFVHNLIHAYTTGHGAYFNSIAMESIIDAITLGQISRNFRLGCLYICAQKGITLTFAHNLDITIIIVHLFSHLLPWSPTRTLSYPRVSNGILTLLIELEKE